jgi:hypothetical protein
MAMEHSEGRTILENNLPEKFSDLKEVRQGDILSNVLCYVTLDNVIKKLTNRGRITSKMTEINAKADDVVVTAKSKFKKKRKEELLKAANEKANEVGSSINQEKTKYLEIKAKRNNVNRNTHLKMGQHNFEIVQTLSFLGSVM